MLNASELLGQMMQTRMGGSASDRVNHAMGGNSPLGGLLGELLGGRGAGSGGGSGGGLGSLSDLLAGFGGVSGGSGGGGLTGSGGLGDLAQRADEVFPGAGATLQDKNQLAMGGLAALAGAVLGGRAAGTGGALGAGLLALLGSLAYGAMKNRGSNDAASAQPAPQDKVEVPVGLREPQTPAEQECLEHTAHLAICAMINAAKADGAIDGGEMGKIMGKLQELGADDEARSFVLGELQKPFDLERLASDVRTPEEAVQVYGASLLAIEVDTDDERNYLQQLAARLGLDAAVVKQVEQVLGVKATT